MADDTLAVVPAGLLAAAQLIAGQAAALNASREHPMRTSERSGTAAAGLSRAVDRYRRGFAQRLSAVAGELTQAAARYASMETGNDAVLNGVVPPGQW